MGRHLCQSIIGKNLMWISNKIIFLKIVLSEKKLAYLTYNFIQLNISIQWTLTENKERGPKMHWLQRIHKMME